MHSSSAWGLLFNLPTQVFVPQLYLYSQNLEMKVGAVSAFPVFVWPALACEPGAPFLSHILVPHRVEAVPTCVTKAHTAVGFLVSLRCGLCYVATAGV